MTIPRTAMAVLMGRVVSLVAAATEDGVVHWGWLTTEDGALQALYFPCRAHVVDASAGIVRHLRFREDDGPIDCIACIAKGS